MIYLSSFYLRQLSFILYGLKECWLSIWLQLDHFILKHLDMWLTMICTCGSNLSSFPHNPIENPDTQTWKAETHWTWRLQRSNGPNPSQSHLNQQAPSMTRNRAGAKRWPQPFRSPALRRWNICPKDCWSTKKACSELQTN